MGCPQTTIFLCVWVKDSDCDRPACLTCVFLFLCAAALFVLNFSFLLCVFGERIAVWRLCLIGYVELKTCTLMKGGQQRHHTLCPSLPAELAT